MPMSALPAPADEQRRAERRGARLVAAAMRAGRSGVNEAFDRFLPEELREVSHHYWTPLPVVRLAATWLREIQARTVVDIGSGAGKFCVAAALLTQCRFTGIEHRASLVEVARGLAGTFGVDDRVRFVRGEVNAAAGLTGDAYYLFNPFGEYSFSSARFTDPDVTFTSETQKCDVEATSALLSRAPSGTFVITYNGFGGSVPRSYAQIDIATRLPGTLRLWKKEDYPGGVPCESTAR